MTKRTRVVLMTDDKDDGDVGDSGDNDEDHMILRLMKVVT